MPTGLPAPFDAALANQVLELTADGKLLPDIAETIGLSAKTINRWCLKNDLFAQSLALARDQGLDVLADSLPGLALKYPPHMARVMSDNIKWLLERRNRKRYGMQVDLNVTTIDLKGALIDARERVQQPNSNLAQIANAQDTEYTLISVERTTDNESAALPPGMPNPFD